MGKDFLLKILFRPMMFLSGMASPPPISLCLAALEKTKESVIEGISNVAALQKTVSFMFMGIRILPGTPLEKIALKEGVIRLGQDLIGSVYYLSPGLDRQWPRKILTYGFKDHRCCFFPADKFESATKILYQMGYSGSLWEMLSPSKMRTTPRATDRVLG